MASIEEQFERVKQDFPDATIRQHGEGHWVEVDSLPLPDGWKPSESRIAIEIPPGFSGTKPEGFWLEPGLGAPPGFPVPPTGGETRYDRIWVKVCYQPQAWDPTRENLWRYVKAMLRYFAEAK